MKTKFKRFSKSTLSVVLSIMMLLSTMIVGEIGTIEAEASEIAYALIGANNINRLGNSSQAGWNWTNYNGTTDFRFNEHYDNGNSKPYISVRMPNLTYFAILRSNNGTKVYGPSQNDTEITTFEQGDNGKKTTDCGYSSNSNNRKGFKFVDTSLADGSTGEYRIHFDNTSSNKWFWINRLYKINTTNDNTKGTLTITTDYPEDNADSSGNKYAQNEESVVFTVTPNAGYTATATMNGSTVDISGGSYTYTMGTSSPNFVVTYTADNVTRYTNTIVENGASGGTISYSSSLAENASSTVTVTTPPTDYRVYSMTAINETTKAVISTVYSNTMTYAMPASGVKVYVTYKQENGFWVTGAVKALGGSGSEVGWNNTTSVDTYLYYVSDTDSYRDVYLTNNQYFTVRNSSSQYGPKPTPTIYADGNAATVLSSNNDRSCKFGSSTGNYRVHYNPTDHKIWVKSIYQVTTSGTTTNAVVGSRYVESGETATVTVYPPSDKYPTITVGGTTVPMTYNSSDGSYTAQTTAGSAAVTFNISYEDISNVTAHTNSYTENGTTGGTVTFTPSGSVNKNTYVEMSVTPPSGYTVSSVSINSGSVTATSSKSGAATIYKYAMPDANVTAAITYEEKTVADGMIYFDNFTHWSSVNIAIDSAVSTTAMTEDPETGLFYFDATEFVDINRAYSVTFSGSGGSKSVTFDDEDDYQKVYTPNGATGETPDEYLNITIADGDINNYVYFNANQYSWTPYHWYMAYMWSNSDDSVKNAEYPGVRMKKVAGYSDIYAIPYSSSYDRVIFNDGTRGAAQTDVTRKDGEYDLYYQENHRSKINDDLSGKGGRVWYPGTTFNEIDNNDHTVRRNGSFGDFPTPDTTADYLRIYAKTGTIRNVSGASSAENGDYDKYSFYSSIDINYTTGDTVTNNTSSPDYMKKNFDSTFSYIAGGQTYYRLLKADVKRNREITVTLTINDTTAQNTYYVRGFNVNGKTYGEYTGKTADNKYSFTYTVRDETTPIEITPVYFYQDDSNCINFQVERFETVTEVWGSTVACYAYYVNGSDIRNHTTKAQATLGGYPGQPLLNHQGIYFTQVPRKDEKGGKIKGITLNNYVWDAVHGGDLIGYPKICGVGSTRTRQARNAQTYDYDDFVALANVEDVNTILFNFKYRTFNRNGADGGNFVNGTVNNNDTLFNTEKFGNEWNGLVDISTVPVDLFGNKLEVADYKDNEYGNTPAVTTHLNYTKFGNNHHYFNEDFIKSGIDVQDKVYIVSDGYVNYYSTSSSNSLKTSGTNYLGEYATMWYVYKKDDANAQSPSSTYTLIGKLPPSAFITDFDLDPTNDAYFETVSGIRKLRTNLTGENIPTKFLQYTKGLDEEHPNDYATGGVARNAMWTQYATIYNEANGMPAVITYESSLASGGRDGATNNPGNRSDGRWYYSRSKEVIPATADLKVWILQPDGTYVKDKLFAPGNATTPDASSIVGATPHFTNDSSYKGTDGQPFTNLNLASVRSDATKNFVFTTESYLEGKDYTVSEGTATATENSSATYTFVGWYLNLDGDDLSEITTTRTTAEKSMEFDSTLVAVYAKVDTSASDKTLVVSHQLFKDAPALTEEPGAHNGMGTPHIQVVIKDSSDNVLKTFADTTGSYQINIANDETLNNPANKVEITLISEADNATTLYDVYRKSDDGTKYLKSGKNADNTYSYSESNGTIQGTINNDDDLTDKKITYTYTVSQLFPEGTNVKKLNFYSDLMAKVISVTVKYYDRDTSNFGQPTDVSSTPKVVNFNAELTDNTIESFVQNNLSRFNVTNNVVDQHYFNFTEYRAVNAIKNMKYYQIAADKTTANPSRTETYGYFFNGSYTPEGESSALPAEALKYHTDCHGIPQYNASKCVDGTSPAMGTREQWVTFYNGTTPVNVNFQEDIDNHLEELGDDPTNSLSDVTSIVVWGYNVPKKYTFTAHYTESKDDDSGVVTFTNDNQKTLNDGTTVYIDLADATPKYGFYNQRIGVEDQRTGLTADQLAAINGGTGYLAAYGITTPYFGGEAEEVQAAKTGTVTLTTITPAVVEGDDDTVTEEIKNLVFDGWYIHDKNGYHKLSSQRSYENRIMNNLNIFAGYIEVVEPESNTTNDSLDVGVAVTYNGVDRYIDEDNIEKVRFNTLLNAYGSDVPEYAGGTNIVDAASVYVYLPKTDTNGHYIDWTDQKNIDAITTEFAKPETKNKIKSDIATHMRKVETARTNANVQGNAIGGYYYTRSVPATSIVIEVEGVEVSNQSKLINCFSFEIVESTPNAANHQLTLTNKNRVQFTMTMPYNDYLNQPFLAFIAIKYAKDGKSSWYVSDNFVSNAVDMSIEDDTVSGNSSNRALALSIANSGITEESVQSKSETVINSSGSSEEETINDSDDTVSEETVVPTDEVEHIDDITE